MTSKLPLPPIAALSLSEQLKAATRQAHFAAERAPLMQALIAGRLSRSTYLELLINLRAIYEALETALARHRFDADAICAAIDLDRLTRLDRLQRDLDAISATIDDGAVDDYFNLSLRPATVRYVERLHVLDANQPSLLIAHAYVRYLGDLSGGQMLRRVVERKLGAPTAFYEFGEFGDVSEVDHAVALTAIFRQRLDALALDNAQVMAIVEEAVDAFHRHAALFEELQHQTLKRE